MYEEITTEDIITEDIITEDISTEDITVEDISAEDISTELTKIACERIRKRRTEEKNRDNFIKMKKINELEFEEWKREQKKKGMHPADFSCVSFMVLTIMLGIFCALFRFFPEAQSYFIWFIQKIGEGICRAGWLLKDQNDPPCDKKEFLNPFILFFFFLTYMGWTLLCLEYYDRWSKK